MRGRREGQFALKYNQQNSDSDNNMNIEKILGSNINNVAFTYTHTHFETNFSPNILCFWLLLFYDDDLPEISMVFCVLVGIDLTCFVYIKKV